MKKHKIITGALSIALLISLSGCELKDQIDVDSIIAEASITTVSTTVFTTEEVTTEFITEATEEEFTTEVSEDETSPETEENNTTGINPDFKAAMDAYEEFYDEYIEFMTKYQQSNDTSAMLADYFKYLSKANEMAEKMGEWDEEKMNDAELDYYLEVQARISQKLLSAAQ